MTEYDIKVESAEEMLKMIREDKLISLYAVKQDLPIHSEIFEGYLFYAYDHMTYTIRLAKLDWTDEGKDYSIVRVVSPTITSEGLTNSNIAFNEEDDVVELGQHSGSSYLTRAVSGLQVFLAVFLSNSDIPSDEKEKLIESIDFTSIQRNVIGLTNDAVSERTDVFHCVTLGLDKSVFDTFAIDETLPERKVIDIVLLNKDKTLPTWEEFKEINKDLLNDLGDLGVEEIVMEILVSNIVERYFPDKAKTLGYLR